MKSLQHYICKINRPYQKGNLTCSVDYEQYAQYAQKSQQPSILFICCTSIRNKVKKKQMKDRNKERRAGPLETAQSNCVHKVWINKINVWIKDLSSSELNTSNIHNRTLFPEMGEREKEV